MSMSDIADIEIDVDAHLCFLVIFSLICVLKILRKADCLEKVLKSTGRVYSMF
jgi:hypothetical protein